MKTRWIVALTLIAGLASLVRHAPLAWVQGSLPEGVGPASGTYWEGQIDNVPLLGSLSVDGGLGVVRLVAVPGDITFSGDVSPGGVRDLILSMPVSRLPMSDTRLVGLSGQVGLLIDQAEFADNRCQSAIGRASTNVLSANESRFDWRGPVISGPVDCVDGRLRVRLSGEQDGQSVAATILTGLDGNYRSDITVITSDVTASNVLALFGFNSDGAGRYTLSEQGRWR